MNYSRFRLITFDVTGTLLKFRSSPGKQYGEVAAANGINCDDKSLSKNFKSHWHRMNREHPNFGRHSGLGWQCWWKEIVKNTFRDCEDSLDDTSLDLIAAQLIDVYETSTCWRHSFGTLALLSYLKSKAVPMGVVSNFDPRLEALLRNTQLRHYFDFVVGSYEAGVSKPSPDIYKLAIEASKVENLRPEECLHVGDTMPLDYRGAKAVGWNAILINDRPSVITKKFSDVNSEHIYPSLYDLHRTFAKSEATLEKYLIR